MPAPKIQTAYDNAVRDIRVVENYRMKSLTLQPQFQGFVAEVLMLRLFSILEKAVLDVSCRVACGAQYTNGVVPTPIVLANSLGDAINKFKSYNRTSSLQTLRFSSVSNTNKAIKYVIPATEPIRQNLSNFGVQFDEMRNVRNQIAHRNSSTYSQYKNVIMRRYGSALKINTSVFLISTTRERIPVIDQYVTTVKLILTDITKGS